jgi:hypothetical protein
VDELTFDKATWKRWRAQHRGKANVRDGINGIRPLKVKHWTKLGALWHRWSHCRRLGMPVTALDVYRCRWDDNYYQGETARPHWHVGRTRHAP